MWIPFVAAIAVVIWFIVMLLFIRMHALFSGWSELARHYTTPLMLPKLPSYRVLSFGRLFNFGLFRTIVCPTPVCAFHEKGIWISAGPDTSSKFNALLGYPNLFIPIDQIASVVTKNFLGDPLIIVHLITPRFAKVIKCWAERESLPASFKTKVVEERA